MTSEVREQRRQLTLLLLVSNGREVGRGARRTLAVCHVAWRERCVPVVCVTLSLRRRQKHRLQAVLRSVHGVSSTVEVLLFTSCLGHAKPSHKVKSLVVHMGA